MKKKFSILYSDDPFEDVKNLCRYIEDFYKSLDVSNVDFDWGAINGIVHNFRNEFPVRGGFQKASPFKQVAAFTLDFVTPRPIKTPLPRGSYGPKLANYQNSIVAYMLSVDALHKAEINREDGTNVILEDRISVSRHFFTDLVTSLPTCIRVYHFRLLSLVYESLAYQANPDASYRRVI